METNTTPMSAMAYTASSFNAKKAKMSEPKSKTAEISSTPDESNSEMFVRPFEELSNPEGYLVFSPF